jgi:hypothetical protein
VTTIIPAPTGSGRVYFVDALRLIASFQMINGHTLDAVMLMSIRGGAFYGDYLWFRGLVSVAFLVVAGIAFHLSTLCRFDKHKADQAAVRHRFTRAGLIILVGYFLRIPWGLFGSNAAGSLDRAQQTDILHCIGMTLLMLEGITLLSRRPSQVQRLAVIGMFVFLLAAPWADTLIQDGQAHFVLNWFSHQGGSLFPLFPWSGFVFAGVVIGTVAFPMGGHTSFRRIIAALVLLSLASFAVTFLDGSLGARLFDTARHHASTNPLFSFEKLSAVLAFLTVLAVLCRPMVRLPRVLATLSRETLAIYAIHLMLLYYPGVAIARRFDHSLDLAGSFTASLFMLPTTIVLTLLWHRFKVGRS